MPFESKIAKWFGLCCETEAILWERTSVLWREGEKKIFYFEVATLEILTCEISAFGGIEGVFCT